MANALAAVAEKTGTTLIFSLCEWGWVSLISYTHLFCISMVLSESGLAVSINLTLTILSHRKGIGGVPRSLTVGEFVTSH
jgi:hypothetical protein